MMRLPSRCLLLTAVLGLAACSDSGVTPTDLTSDTPATTNVRGSTETLSSPTAAPAGLRARSVAVRPSGGYVNSSGALILEQNVVPNNAWGGYYTDLVNLNPANIVRVSNINVKAGGFGTYVLKAYMRQGTSVGRESSAEGWTLVSQSTLSLSNDPWDPAGPLFDLPLSTPFDIPVGGTAGLYIVIDDGSVNARVTGNSMNVNTQTSDANLRINQAPGRWSNYGLFSGTVFENENIQPQLRVTYSLFSPYSGPCPKAGDDCQQTGAGGGPLTPSTPPGGSGLGAPGSAGPGAPGAPGGNGGRILPPGNRPPV